MVRKKWLIFTELSICESVNGLYNKAIIDWLTSMTARVKINSLDHDGPAALNSGIQNQESGFRIPDSGFWILVLPVYKLDLIN